MMSNSQLEVCSSSIDDVVAAIEGGADRVELCRDLEKDGLTPDYEIIRTTVGLSRNAGRHFDVMVLVRCRPGGFVYTDEEKALMKRSVSEIISLCADGVVVGSLNPDGSVDSVWVREIVKMAHASGLSVTFHRAFDHVADFSKALEALVSAGVDRVLTAGGRDGAEKGADTLSKLISRAGDRIIVMPGGGVRSSNISYLKRTTGAGEYHSSCRYTSAGGHNGANVEEIRKIAQFLKEDSIDD